MKEGFYDDDFLKFLFQLEVENFKWSLAIEKKFAEFTLKEKEKQASLQTTKILPLSSQM